MEVSCRNEESKNFTRCFARRHGNFTIVVTINVSVTLLPATSLNRTNRSIPTKKTIAFGLSSQGEKQSPWIRLKRQRIVEHSARVPSR